MTNEVTTDQIARWERLRAAGVRINGAIADLAAELGASDPLDRLAIMSGITPAVTDQIHEQMGVALDQHRTWPEIAAAVGEGDDRRSSLRVRAAYHRRRLAELEDRR